MSAEEWRPVPGFPGYEVSDLGRVRSFRTWRGQPGPRILRTPLMSSPLAYRHLSLYRDGKHSTARVYRLVAAAFLGPKPDGLEIRHLNGDSTDDRASNLAWGTHSENQFDQVAHGTHIQASKEACPAGHPYDAENTAIGSKGDRRCRACRRARRRAERQAARARRTGVAA